METANEKKYWCNFCGLRTDDRAEYLAHRCTDPSKPPGPSAKDADEQDRKRLCR